MTKEEAIEKGWCVCPRCGEIYAGLLQNGLCWECDFVEKHPNAQKQFCKNCIHFRNHAVYDPKDKTECSCSKHLEAKTIESYHYTCRNYCEQQTLNMG